jgi:FkbH-like protein
MPDLVSISRRYLRQTVSYTPARPMLSCYVSTQAISAFRCPLTGRTTRCSVSWRDGPRSGNTGHLSAAMPGSRLRMTQQLNARLAEAALAQGGAVAVVDCERIASLEGKLRWVDPRFAVSTGYAVAPSAALQLARHTAAVLAARLAGPRKCLIVDLDNTLWGGVVGEEGLDGLRIDAASGGESFALLQEYLLQLRARGVLLAVVTKNNLTDARAPFERLAGMRLRLDDFASFVASWDSKVEGVRRVAQELAIGLGAITVLDDHPAECEEIRQRLPDVDVIELPGDPAMYVRVLADYLGFEPGALTDDDRARASRYRAQLAIAQERDAAGSLDAFLSGLEMHAAVSRMSEATLPRVAQLMLRTNQFNLTAKRHGIEQLRRFMLDQSVTPLVVHLQDRFADHGLVGVVVGLREEDGNALVLESWLLSCRVLGRGLETAVLAVVSEHAATAGYSLLRGVVTETERNVVSREVYRAHGFACQGSANSADGTVWEYALKRLGPIPRPGHIQIQVAAAL